MENQTGGNLEKTMTVHCNCVIEDLQKIPFSRRNFNEKKNIVEQGRPQPDIEITTVIQRCKRHFSTKFYETYDWLTGCKGKQKLFCWPCLLFSNAKSVWNTTGFDDMNNLSKSAKKHGKETATHFSSMIAFKMFGKNRIENVIDTARSVSIEQYNIKVSKNRFIIKCLIDVACHLACQELSFRGNDESAASSNNRGNYVERVNLLASYNSELKSHLEKATVFSGLSGDIQNDLLTSIAFVIVQEIKNEIKVAKFVGVMLDESTDVSNKSQLSILLRYTSELGEPVERFMGFVDVSLSRTSQALFDFIIPFLDKLEARTKIVCQSYDGAAVMSGHSNGLQKKIRDVIPTAHFIHCFAHKLNLVLSQCCSRNKHCAGFFKSLHGFVSFFNHSSKRLAVFNNFFIKKKISTASSTRWEYNGRLVQTIFGVKTHLKDFFQDIIENDDQWDHEAVLQSRGLLHVLNDKKFIILLYFFNEFFPQSDILFKILQKKSTDMVYCLNEIEKFKYRIKRTTDNFGDFWKNIEESESFVESRTRGGRDLNSKEDFQVLLLDIVEKILEELDYRFASLPTFEFVQLFDGSKFQAYANNFPDHLIINLQKSYPNMFDCAVLKTELKVIYDDDNFKRKDLESLTKFMVKNDLHCCFTEIFKLCQLILTLAMTTASVERSFSSLKRIKTALRNRCEQFRLNNLAIISIEKDMVKILKSRDDFYDKVIDHFAQNERRIELKFKS